VPEEFGGELACSDSTELAGGILVNLLLVIQGEQPKVN